MSTLIRRNGSLSVLLENISARRIKTLPEWNKFVEDAIETAATEVRESGLDPKYLNTLRQLGPGMAAVGQQLVMNSKDMKSLVDPTMNAFENLAKALDALMCQQTAAAIRKAESNFHTNWAMLLGIGIPAALFMGFGVYQLYQQLKPKTATPQTPDEVSEDEASP